MKYVQLMFNCDCFFPPWMLQGRKIFRKEIAERTQIHFSFNESHIWTCAKEKYGNIHCKFFEFLPHFGGAVVKTTAKDHQPTRQAAYIEITGKAHPKTTRGNHIETTRGNQIETWKKTLEDGWPESANEYRYSGEC